MDSATRNVSTTRQSRQLLMFSCHTFSGPPQQTWFSDLHTFLEHLVPCHDLNPSLIRLLCVSHGTAEFQLFEASMKSESSTRVVQTASVRVTFLALTSHLQGLKVLQTPAPSTHLPA